MAQNSFNLTAQLQLRGPTNLKQVAAKLNRDLTQAVRGDISFNTTKANKQIGQLSDRLAKLRTNLAAVSKTGGLGNLTPQLNSVAKSGNLATKSMGTFSASIAASTKSMASFVLGAGLLLGSLNAIKAGLAEGVKFQSEFVRIGTVAGKSSNQLKGLKDQVHGLATGLGVNSKGLIESAMTLTQTGLAAEKTRVALKALALSDLSPTFDNIKSTTEGAISLLGSFGHGVDKLQSDLGSLSSVAAKYAVESEDLVTAIKKSGAAFSIAGGNLNELIGLFTSVRSKTRESADSISVAFRNIFSRLQRVGTQKRLKDLLNVDLAENGVFVGPMKAIERLHHAVADLPKGSTLFARVAEEIGGIRQISKTVPLLLNYKDAVEAVGVAERGQGRLLADSIAAQSSLAVQLTRTTEAWKRFAHNLVDSDGFKSTASALLSIASSAAKVAESLTPLLPMVSALIGVKLSKSVLSAGFKLMGKAQGGFISSGRGEGIDDVPIMAGKNEYVMSAKAVKRIGVGTLDAINSGRIGKFARGGIVNPTGSIQTYAIRDAESGVVGLGSALKNLITIIKDESAKVRSERSVEKGNPPGYALATTPSRRSRARAAMQFATAIPLSRMSFDESAAAVVGGGSGDFIAKRSTYGLAPAMSYHEQLLNSPEQPLQRNRNFRAMSRSEREARIIDRGYGSTLSSVRRSALAGYQSDYFGRIGFQSATGGVGIGRRALGSARNAIGSTTSFLKNRVGLNSQHALLAAGAVALNPSTENFVSGIAGDKTGKAFGGAASGALVGGSLGSALGPMGTAVGLLAGGTLGAVKALESFQKNLLSDKIEKGFTSIEESAGELASALQEAGGKITPDILKKANALDASQLANRSQIEQFKGKSESSFSESYGHTVSGLGGGFLNLFDSTKGKTLGQRFSSGFNSPFEAAEKQRQQTIARHELANLERGADSDSKLRSGLLGQSKVVGDYGRSIRGQTIQENQARANVLGKEISGEFKSSDRLKNIAAEIAAIRQRDMAEEQSTMAIRLNADALDSFERSATAATSVVVGLNNRFADMQNALKSVDNRNSLLHSMTGSGPASIANNRHSEALSRFGSAGFEQSAGMLGTQAGALLTHANRAHNALSSALPGLLRSQDIGTDQGFSNFRGNVSQVLGLNGVGGDLHKNALTQLDKLHQEGGLQSYATGLKNEDLISKLVRSDQVNAAHSASQTQLQNAESHQQRVLTLGGQLAGLRNSAGEASDHNAVLRLETQRTIAQQKVDRFGGSEANYLKPSDYQRPFELSQQRLTGLGGKAALDPRAIADRVVSLTGKVDMARQRIESNPGDLAAAAGLRRFESELQNAVLGLRNLTDSSKSSAGNLERLAVLKGDQQSRQSFAEKFLRASPKEKAEMNQAALLTQHAGKHGIESLPEKDRGRVFDFLDSMGDAQAFGTGLTGPQLKDEIVRRSPTYQQRFKPTQKMEDERKALEGQQRQNAQRAEAAGGMVAGMQNVVADQFAQNNGLDGFLKQFNGSTMQIVTAGNVFNTAANTFAKAADTLKGIPHEIAVSVKGTQEIVINGGEMLAKLSPQILELADKSAKQSIAKQLAKHFPDGGPYNA